MALQQSSIPLINQIETVWVSGAGMKAKDWADELKKTKKALTAAGRQFKEPYPLQVYTSYTRATKSHITYSLRYLGQQVAVLSVKGSKVTLKISPSQAKTNELYFGIKLSGPYDWSSPEAQKFRKEFRKLNPNKINKPVKSEEHLVESEFLRQMADPTRNKFGGTFKNIQPVLLADCPFQFPLPIAGNTGKPVLMNGNIDILARRGTGKGTKISVWELKRPTRTDHAIEQVYIYAVTLIKMLRTPITGDIWYQDIIGFGNKVPDKLIIECVVAVCLDPGKRPAFEQKMRDFKKANNLMIDKDSKITLHIAHYDKEPLQVQFVDI